MASTEVLVCDNGSSDGTSEVVQGWCGRSGRVRLIQEPRPGKPAAWNALMNATPASLVIFLDADTVPQPGSVARLAAAARETPHLAFAGRRRFVSHSPRRTHQGMAWLGDPVLELCLAGNFYALRREPMLQRLRELGFERMPNVFAEDIWLQSLLEPGELRRVDAAAEIVVDTLPAYLELHARKRLVLHELRRHYPELATRLLRHFPEALLPLPQVRAVLWGQIPWPTKGRWVAGGVAKALMNFICAARLTRLAAALTESFELHGGAEVLRRATLRRQRESS